MYIFMILCGEYYPVGMWVLTRTEHFFMVIDFRENAMYVTTTIMRRDACSRVSITIQEWKHTDTNKHDIFEAPMNNNFKKHTDINKEKS